MKSWAKFLLALALLAAEPDAAVAARRRAKNVTASAEKGEDDVQSREGRILSPFQIITFPNDPCQGSGGKNGTCYTAAECSNLGGTNAGSCASGFGVCCTFTVTCGQTSFENCTYFDSNAVTAGACSVRICPCGTDICQLRLDFTSFQITGPTTITTAITKTKNGVAAATATALQSAQTQCQTDTFSVTSSTGPAPPTICGTNTGQHMYVNSDPGCNTLAFQLGNTGVGAAIGTRQWSIKVTQYSCSFPNLAPTGCTEYFFGAATGNFESYNYNNGNGGQLANQMQSFCIRRETGFCRICYYAVINTDFDVSGATDTANTGLHTSGTCCGYTAAGEGIKGFDCIQIPGANKQTTANMPVKSNICGNIGLVTASAGTAVASVCSTRTPFVLNYLTDNFEGVMGAISEGMAPDAGFTLGYTMDSINC